MTMTLRQWPPRWRPKRGLPQWGRQKGSMWFAPTPTSPWTPWNSPWFELELVDLKFVHTCCPQWTPGTLIRFEPRSSTSRGVQPILYCETQPPASIGWVALSSMFVRPTIWCFRPYKPYIFCEDMILATCQCQHILCIHYWVEPSLLLSSFIFNSLSR